jgi:hypothetical protein
VTGFELCDPERGVFAAAGPDGTAVVFDHGDVLGAGTAEVKVELGEAGGTAALALDGVRLEADLQPLAGPVVLEGALTGATELRLCRALGSARGRDGERELACLAVANRALGEPQQEAGLRRSITVALADGGLVAIRAARPAGAAAHDEEEVTAAMLDPGGPVEIDEVLVSTEYDSEGRHRRATLELWPQGGPLVRGAGAIVCGATVRDGGPRIEEAFFRWSIDGRPGLGRYEIVSPA